MSKPKIEMIDPKVLVPYDKNPRNNADAIEVVARSIELNGFTQPILIDQNNRICIGHTRRESAILIKMKKVPCIRKEMSEEQFIQICISDNKTGEIADWDEELLTTLLMDLDHADALDVPGIDTDDLDKLLFGDEEKSGSKDKSSKSSKSESSDSNPTSKMTFILPTKHFLDIDAKLDIIAKENNLDTQADALVFVMKKYKGNTKVKRVRNL